MSENQGTAATHDDPNTIVTLVGCNARTNQVWADPHNKDFYLPPVSQATHGRVRKWVVDSKNRSRQLTPDPNDPARVKSREPALRITFSKKPKNPKLGYLLGSDRTLCDIFLGSADDSISEQMFALSFNRYNEVIMTSFSKYDVLVSYGKQQVKRKKFTWIFPSDQKNVVVEAGDRIEFKVEVPKHETDMTSYERNCQDFLKLAKSASRTLHLHNLSSQPDRLISGTATSQLIREPRFYLRTLTIGEGSFGKVYKARSMPDGRTVAVKRFKSKHAWALEKHILRKISRTPPHDYIVQFIDLGLEEKPYLVMGFAPGGNLEDQHKLTPFTNREIAVILRQMLGALDFLHVGCKMVHRDVKPENILCDSRAKFRLADFGVAKEGHLFESRKGTERYFAPEMFSEEPYTVAVDIYALGLVIARFLTGGLPRACRVDEGARWCQAMVDNFEQYFERSRKVQDRELEQISLTAIVRDHMLKMRPEERASASSCLERAHFLWWTVNQESNDNSKLSPQEESDDAALDEDSEVSEDENETSQEKDFSGDNTSEAETERTEARPLNTDEWASLEREFEISRADSEEIEDTLGTPRDFIDARPVNEPENTSERSITANSAGYSEHQTRQQSEGDPTSKTATQHALAASPATVIGARKPLLKRKRSSQSHSETDTSQKLKAYTDSEVTAASQSEAWQVQSEEQPLLDN